MKLRDILAQLEFIYAVRSGPNCALSESEERLWLQDQFPDRSPGRPVYAEERRNILWQLTAAEGWSVTCTRVCGSEALLSRGGELIPLLDDLIQSSGAAESRSVIGMAHRGRLNVLVICWVSRLPCFSRNSRQLRPQPPQRLGTSNTTRLLVRSAHPQCMYIRAGLQPSTRGGQSVVEGSDPRAPGAARRREGQRVLPNPRPWDAAFAGQASAWRPAAFAGARVTTLAARATGHQQPGLFPRLRIRETLVDDHTTDVPKMLEAPIFHVNTDDPRPWCLSRAWRSYTA